MPYNKSFIDQASSVKIAGHWPRSLFAFLWTSTSSRSIKAEGESSAGVQPSWPRAWSIIYTSWTAWSLKQLAVQHKSWSSSENSLQSTWPCYAGMLARELPSLISFPVLALCHSRLKTLEIKKQNRRKFDHFLRHKAQTTTLDVFSIFAFRHSKATVLHLQTGPKCTNHHSPSSRPMTSLLQLPITILIRESLHLS